MTLRGVLRSALRGLGYALLAFGAVLALALLTAVLVLGTAAGRQSLLEHALAAARGGLPGTLAIERLERASPYGVALAGLSVRDPTALEVLRIERVEVELDPWPLARGRIIVPRVLIESGFVDASDIGRQDRGLLAAFVDPHAPPAPPSGAPPPYVRLGALEVRGLSVRAPDTPPLGAVNVVGLAMVASFELDATPRAVLKELSAGLERDGAELGRVERLSGLLGRGAEPSEIELRAAVAGSRIELSARAVLPPHEAWREAPLETRLAVSGVNGRALAGLLRAPALESAFAGDVGVELAVQGTPNDLPVRATIASAGGPITLDARIQNLERAEVELRAARLEPWRVRAELPAQPIAFTLRAKVNAADRERIPISLQIPEASFGGEPLPLLSLAARFEDDTFREIALELARGQSALRVSGEASLAGAVGLDVKARLAAAELERLTRLVPQGPKLRGPITADLRVERSPDERMRLAGELSASTIAAGETSLEHVQASFDLAGPLFGGRLNVELRGLTLAGQRVPRAKLAVGGSGRQYRLNAEATHAEGQAALAVAIELAGDEVTLHGNAHGKARGEPFALEIAPTRLRSGSVVTRGLRLRIAEQELALRGTLAEAHSELALETSTLDLATLGKLAASPEKLSGSARLNAGVSGPLAAPHVTFALESSGASIGDRPALDARLDGTLDARGGQAELALAVKSAAPDSARALSLEIAAKHEFAGGRRWLRGLEAGEANVRIELARLDLAFVEAWLGAPLGASGNTRLDAELHGTLAHPELALRSRVVLTPAGQQKSLTLEPRLSYAAGRLELSLPVSDAGGRWLESEAKLDLGSRALTDLARDVRAGLAAARWSLEAKLAERELSALPVALGELPPAAFSARISAGAEPGREPRAELFVALRQTQAQEGILGCNVIGTASELELKLQHGALRATLGATSGERRLFRAHATAELALAALLTGGGARLGRLDAGLLAESLDLASLPLLCGRVAGTLDSDIALADALGERPSLTGTIRTQGLSLGTKVGLDAGATLRADRDQFSVDASIGTRDGTSTLHAQMPIAWSGGRLRVERDAPFELHAQLKRLPIAPLLDPRGAISYATGSVSGEVRADGKLSAPRARGELELKNVAFTATSLAQPLSDIEGRLVFTEHSLEIQDLHARDKDGELELDGSINLPEPGSVGARLHVVTKRFPLRQEGQVVATSDVDARVDATVTPERTIARVTLQNVDTWIETASGISGLALDSHPEFVIDGQAPQRERGSGASTAGPAAAAGDAGQAPEESEPARVTELSLDATDRFWVKRDDFAVKLATKLEARIQGDEVRVTGKVGIDRGYLSLLGKIFTLERDSHLEFVGSEAPDPIVDITASHENRRAGKTIKVQITGRGSKPVLAFLIDDRAASAGDAFLAIYGNQQSNERPGEASDQARQFVGGLAAGLLATSARRELGAAAPIIMVEPGEQTGQGRVRAGLELDSLVPRFLQGMITGVYFEGIVARESENPEKQQASVQGGALLELYFPNGFFSTGQYGPGSTWSLDWGWQL